MASWAKYLTSMSESVASFSSTGFTSVWRALKQTKSIVYERFHFIVKDALRLADVLAVEDRANLLQGLGHIEADISHLVVGHLQDHGQHLLCGDLLTACFWQSLRHRGKKEVSNTFNGAAEPLTVYTWKMAFTHIDAEQRGHPVEVIGVIGHTKNFGYDGVLSPLCSKLLHKLHQVTSRRLTDGIDYKYRRFVKNRQDFLHTSSLALAFTCKLKPVPVQSLSYEIPWGPFDGVILWTSRAWCWCLKTEPVGFRLMSVGLNTPACHMLQIKAPQCNSYEKLAWCT